MSTPHDGQNPRQDDARRDPSQDGAASRGDAQGEPPSRHTPAHPPALKRTVIRPPTPTGPDAVDSAYVATRLTTLTHELSTLLDGSLRVIGLARRSLDSSGPRGGAVCPEQLSKHLATVTAAMMQMAELVRESSLTVSDSGLLGMRSGFGATSSVSEAVRHAVDVMSPIAEDSAIRIDTDIAAELDHVVAGPIFAVVTNGIRNAIESIQRHGERYVGGQVYVRAWTQAVKNGRCVVIEVLDDGHGLPRGASEVTSADADQDRSIFTLGFSTKPGGSGIGLSLCRDIVHQLGGTIELRNRKQDPHSGRGGAVLNVTYPIPHVLSDRALAG